MEVCLPFMHSITGRSDILKIIAFSSVLNLLGSVLVDIRLVIR